MMCGIKDNIFKMLSCYSQTTAPFARWRRRRLGARVRVVSSFRSLLPAKRGANLLRANTGFECNLGESRDMIVWFGGKKKRKCAEEMITVLSVHGFYSS